MDTMVNLTGHTLRIECDFFEWTTIEPADTVARVTRRKVNTEHLFAHPKGARLEMSVISFEETIT